MARFGFFVDDKPWVGSRALHIRVSYPDRSIGLMLPPEFKNFEFGAASETDAPAALVESYEDRQDNRGDVTDFLQGALEAAWALGLRPKEYDAASHTLELAAVRYHLEDMRALAKVVKP